MNSNGSYLLITDKLDIEVINCANFISEKQKHLALAEGHSCVIVVQKVHTGRVCILYIIYITLTV